MVDNMMSISERAWLFSAHFEHWKSVAEHRTFGTRRHYALLSEAQLGDPCVAFVPRYKVFVGLGKITGHYYQDETTGFRYRIPLDMSLNLKSGVPLTSLSEHLRFVKDKAVLLDLRNGVTQISISDYEVIRSALEQRIEDESPQSTTVERTQREIEGEESEAPDPHTKAEHALLELGSMLGCYTYVTADDRNKTYQGKPLSEIAMLQEIPNFASPEILRTARRIDVIWFDKEEFPICCFEVEQSTGISRGLLRLFQLRNFDIGFMIVAPDKTRKKFAREVDKAPFRGIRSRFRFMSYGHLDNFVAITKEFVNEGQSFLGERFSFYMDRRFEEV